MCKPKLIGFKHHGAVCFAASQRCPRSVLALSRNSFSLDYGVLDARKLLQFHTRALGSDELLRVSCREAIPDPRCYTMHLPSRRAHQHICSVSSLGQKALGCSEVQRLVCWVIMSTDGKAHL